VLETARLRERQTDGRAAYLVAGDERRAASCAPGISPSFTTAGINPDSVKNQIEGNVVQTPSRTLGDESDWAGYPILLFPEIPDIDIELIERPNDKPWRGGEPAAAIVPSAVANTVFDAIGVRLRSVPFSPAKLLGALRSA
jgi:CO/xanthine dehydrogenase Mo-binding subunit